jgi:hypothetical protein
LKKRGAPSIWLQTSLEFAVVFLLTALLIAPWFRAGYLDLWGSIESTFIADARFLIAHWPHPGWQPLWYTGTRFDYIYPPALRYGTAILSMATGIPPVRAYHIYTGLLYCIGIAAVYLMIRVCHGSRGAAWLGAAATALLSPSFVFLDGYRHDAAFRLPLRLNVLMKYGEGPHMSALALIPLALAFTWIALDKRRPVATALAGIFSAAVVSHNFYGATALGLFFALLCWSFWMTRPDRRLLVPTLLIPASACGVTAFWLTPSYVRITAENMRYVAHPGTPWSVWVALVVAAVFAFASWRLGCRKPERTWAIFAVGSAIFLSLNVLGNYFAGFRITGEPHRLIPELDLALIWVAVSFVLWLWKIPGRWPKAAGALIVAAAFATAAGYARHAWKIFPRTGDYRNRVEYKIPEWLWNNLPEARVRTGGSVRFWFDGWRDLAQMSGGSDQGLMNDRVMAAEWAVRNASDGAMVVPWLQALGVDAVYVSAPGSEEVYHDIEHPEEFAGVLPVLYDDGRGNRLYGVPRRDLNHGRIVDTERLRGLTPMLRFEDVQAYVKTVERGPDIPVSLEQNGPDRMLVKARLAPGQSLLIQETYDPAWEAWSGHQRLAVTRDPMGFLLVDTGPGDKLVELRFTVPVENQVGRAITVLTVLAIAGLLFAGRHRKGMSHATGFRI